MSRQKKTPAAIASLEAAPLEPKPKRRRSAAKETIESREPTPVAAVLEQSPIAAIIADHEAKAKPEGLPASFAEAVKASKSAFGPIPDGFVNVDSHPAAGIKVNRSLDRKVSALQFAEDRLPTRAEKDILEAVGESGKNFVYKTARRQWERYDPESPGANLVDAKRVAADLAREREGLGR